MAVVRPDGVLRAFNPDPPCSASRAAWEAVEDLLILRFGWSDPRVPERQRLLGGPSWWLKQQRSDMCQPRGAGQKLMDGLLDAHAAGQLRNRSDSLHWLADACRPLGLVLHGIGDGHATVGAPGAPPQARRRLRGLLLSNAFTAPEALAPSPDDLQRRRADLSTAPSRLDRAWRQRARFNQGRYGQDRWRESEFSAGDWLHRPLHSLPLLIPAQRLTPSLFDTELPDAAPH